MLKKRIVWVLSFLVTSFSLCGCSSDVSEVHWDVQTECISETEEAEAETELQTFLTESQSIYVDICGAVVHPGVYELKEGDRVYQVIELAGGLLEEADDTAINRAEVLEDGRKIRIYTKDEIQSQIALQQLTEVAASESADSGRADQKVNINTADESQLISLPGIGSSRAGDIIAYRSSHGSFSSIEEIMNVPGIKQGTFEKLADKITVE